MKRTIVFSVAVFILAFLVISYIPVTISHAVKVSYPMDKTMEQFLGSKSLAKWFNEDSTQYKLKVTPINPATLNVYATDANNRKRHIVITMTPDASNPLTTIVTMKMKGHITEKLFPGRTSTHNLNQLLNKLQAYMEDSERMYGFKIRKTLVSDTTFLYMTRTVPTTSRQEETKKIFDKLISFAAANNITYNGVRIFHTERINRETIQLFASIGVSSYVPEHPSDSILVKHMPYKKNLLEAEFEGRYKDADSVYQALEAYKSDRNLINMAIPYQKFITPGYGFADTQRVRINVYYPFY
jgi:hypothetical protein